MELLGTVHVTARPGAGVEIRETAAGLARMSAGPFSQGVGVPRTVVLDLLAAGHVLDPARPSREASIVRSLVRQGWCTAELRFDRARVRVTPGVPRALHEAHEHFAPGTTAALLRGEDVALVDLVSGWEIRCPAGMYARLLDGDGDARATLAVVAEFCGVRVPELPARTDAATAARAAHHVTRTPMRVPAAPRRPPAARRAAVTSDEQVRTGPPEHHDELGHCDSARLGVLEALRSRRSARQEEAALPLGRDALGGLLCALFCRSCSPTARAYPSGGALYSLRPLACCTGVSGLPDGVYEYDPDTHAVRPLGDGPWARWCARGAAARMGWARAPRIVVSLVAELDVVASNYPIEGFASGLVTAEFGAVLEAAHLAGAALGLRVRGMGAGPSEHIADRLGWREVPAGDFAVTGTAPSGGAVGDH